MNIFYGTSNSYIINNKLSSNCVANIFGDACSGNIFAPNCYGNLLGAADFNIFGNLCYGNVMEGSGSNYNTLGSRCYNNYFPVDSSSTDGSINIIIGNYCYHNTVRGNNITCGVYCHENTICGSGITLGRNCYLIYFESYAYDISFGNECFNISFESYASNISFGSDCGRISLGDNFNNISFGHDCYSISFSDNNQNLIDYVRDIIIDNECSYLRILSDDTTATSSNYLQNVHIHMGVQGTANSTRVISVPDRKLQYSIDYYANNSQTIILDN